MDSFDGVFGLGQTYFGETTADSTSGSYLEGMTKLFNDLPPKTGSGAQARRTQKKKLCVLVRNGSGFTLGRRRMVAWQTAYRGRRVAGYTTTTDAQVAGVVDEHLGTAGVLSNDLFWLTIAGPSLVTTALGADANNLIVEHDMLGALTAVTSGSTTAGRPYPCASTLTGLQVMNMLGRAISAATTANTNTDILVDVWSYKTTP